MKFSALLVIGALPLAAQDIAPKDSERDPVLTALLDEGPDGTGESTPIEPDPPVLVTGNPPEEAELVGGAEAETDEPGESAELEEPAEVEFEEPEAPSTEPEGVNVEVEGGTTPGPIHSSEVKLLAPFPAKPLSTPPAGWKIVQPEGVPAFSETVELANGTEIDLSIKPHLLVPDADGSRIFALSEPGFDATLGYAQTDTIGSVLADSIRELDDNGDRLDDAARRLSELLDSLPAPPVAPEQPEQEP